jgi:hypothetical protein
MKFGLQLDLHMESILSSRIDYLIFENEKTIRNTRTIRANA